MWRSHTILSMPLGPSDYENASAKGDEQSLKPELTVRIASATAEDR